MTLPLYIDTSKNQLLTSLNNATPVNALNVPLFIGDTILVQVFLLAPLQVQNPSQFNYSNIGTAGKALMLFLDNGQIEQSPSYTVYTQLVNWNTDPNNQYFYGVLSLNTAALKTLIGSATTTTCYLHIGYVDANGNTTDLLLPITLLAGIPNAVNDVPAGLTPLSVEAANQIYVRADGNPNNPGASFVLISPLGKKILIQAVDNGDGTARFDASPIN